MRLTLYVGGGAAHATIGKMFENVVESLCASDVELEIKPLFTINALDISSIGTSVLTRVDSKGERRWYLKKPKYGDIIMTLRDAGVRFSIPAPQVDAPPISTVRPTNAALQKEISNQRRSRRAS
jgi:hypothetical protein